MDAGWYINDGTWVNTGTWEVDPARFPHGLRAISDHAHARGVKILVWFEPERVTPGTWLYKNHPEWLLGPDGQQKLLNLGDAEARQWLVEHMDRLLVEQGIDLYRQDFNMDPLPFWQANEAEDRQGITEIYHVMGYLAYWDELRRRHPDMLIDTCASGGRRNDLETLRRAVPLHRSDYSHQAVGNQCHTYGMAFWIPYYGTGVPQIDAYVFRSTMCPFLGYGPDVRQRDLDYRLQRRLLAEWRAQVADNYFGDYYPLTSYSYEDDVWMAWQFDRPEAGKGVVQAFRRAQSPFESARFRLHGLDPAGRYVVTDLDTGQPQHFAGRELMDAGLQVTLRQRPAAAVITYCTVRGLCRCMN
jgi:alpha-galactosidase